MWNKGFLKDLLCNQFFTLRELEYSIVAKIKSPVADSIVDGIPRFTSFLFIEKSNFYVFYF